MAFEQLKEKIQAAFYPAYVAKISQEDKISKGLEWIGTGLIFGGAIALIGAGGATVAVVPLALIGTGVAATGAVALISGRNRRRSLIGKALDRDIDNGALLQRYEAEILPAQAKALEQDREELKAAFVDVAQKQSVAHPIAVPSAPSLKV